MDVKDLTGAGWLLIIVTIIGALGIGIPLLVAIEDALPAGRYPKIMFILPTLIIGALIFWGGSKLMRAKGIAVTKRDPR